MTAVVSSGGSGPGRASGRTDLAQHPVTFRAFFGTDGLEAIRSEWDAVAARLAHPGFHHLRPWHEAFAHHLAADPSALVTFVAYAGDGSPTAIVPLVSASRRLGGVPLRALQVPNHPDLPFGDFVVDPPAANGGLVHALVEHIQSGGSGRWDALVMEGLLEDGAAASSLRGAPPARLVTEPARPVDYLECMPIDSRLALVSKNFRAALRKSRNKLALEPQVEFVRATTPESVADAFNRFLVVEASGWKAAHGSAVASNPRVEAFYRLVTTEFAALGIAEINLLVVGGTCIAAQLCLTVDRCLYVLKIGYDEQYSKLAPGNRLLEHVLQRSAEQQDVDAVNLTTDTAWHADWKPSRHRRLNAFVLTDTWRGRAAHQALRIKDRVRPLYKRWMRQMVVAPSSKSFDA